jgi:hypothetical protein
MQLKEKWSENRGVGRTPALHPYFRKFLTELRKF